MSMRDRLDRIAPLFEPGGRYQKMYPVYEMVDTFLYSINYKTNTAPHARAAIDLKRVMTYVVLATFPAILVGLFNVGWQANLAIKEMGGTESMLAQLPWQSDILYLLGIGFNPENPFANVLHGFVYFLPIYLVTLISGGIVEVLFAIVRKHDVNEGFFVSSMLYTLTMPPNVPLWQVSIGIIFGVIIGKEVFGGTGKNFLNPALTGRAFLYFAYPASISGDKVWVAIDGYTSATILGQAAINGYESVVNFTWFDAFIGLVPGCIGETSAVAIAIGGLFLVATKIANYRLILGCLLGMFALSSLYNFIGSDTNPMFTMPWYWHLVSGGFMFGLVFMVTEPVSAAMTNAGRWAYGFLIGAVCITIRVVNPAFPEGIMLAILFGNMFAPLIDYTVVKLHIKKRAALHVKS